MRYSIIMFMRTLHTSLIFGHVIILLQRCRLGAVFSVLYRAAKTLMSLGKDGGAHGGKAWVLCVIVVVVFSGADFALIWNKSLMWGVFFRFLSSHAVKCPSTRYSTRVQRHRLSAIPRPRLLSSPPLLSIFSVLLVLNPVLRSSMYFSLSTSLFFN